MARASGFANNIHLSWGWGGGGGGGGHKQKRSILIVFSTGHDLYIRNVQNAEVIK